jgi:excisionase family DNA binding protein
MSKLTLLSKKEALMILKISERTLDRMMKEKEIPYIKIRTRTMFRLESLEKWVKANEATNRS